MAPLFDLIVPPAVVQQVQALLAALQAHPAGLAINALALLVLAALALRWAASVLQFVWAYFLRPGRNLRKYGEWAVVTGATDGIGKAYCEQLAKQGERRAAPVAALSAAFLILEQRHCRGPP